MRPLHTLAATGRALLGSRKGATAVEYGLILALIVLAMFLALQNFAGVTIKMWRFVAERVVAAG